MAWQRGQGGQTPPDTLGEFGRMAPQLPYRRLVTWTLLFTGVILLFIILNIAKSVYTDWLWFDALGYKDVFATRIFTRLWLFFAGAGVFIAFFWSNIYLAQRLAGRDEPSVLPPETILLIRSLTRVGIFFFMIVFALVFGSVASNQWEHMLLFKEAQNFVDLTGAAISDPLFGHNPSFYIFDLPFLRFLQTWFLGIVLLLLLGAVAIYGVGYSLRGFQWAFPKTVKLHVGILVALLALNVTWSYWFDINELVLASRGLSGTLFGASATDANATLFSLRFMMGLTSFLAIVAVASAFAKHWQVPAGAFGVWAVAAIVALAIYPAAYQRLTVQPSELAQETQYIEDNIAFTRAAYGLDRIETRKFEIGEDLTADDVIGNSEVVDNIRLWDHRPLRDTYNQIQFLRPYYQFVDVDVDRYLIDGRVQQVMLSARELAPENLPGAAQNWVAQRLQYTHGFGVAMSPVTDFTEEGRPEFFLKDIPPKGVMPVDRPEIYYGERSRSYVIVNSNVPEFSYPTADDTPVFTSYEGDGGIKLNSFIRKAAFSWRFGEFNILISGEISDESKIQFARTVPARVSKLAPFLSLDSDPYMVVADGRLFWVQDAYTTANRYPYSRRIGNGLNYIRNSVKVVVDAFHGTVDFYVMDEDDAVLKTYERIFPDLFKPLSEMPPSIVDNLRYPEDLFNIQEEVYRAYHVTDPRVFFTQEDLWSRPSEIFYGVPQRMESYYVNMPLPGETEAEFLLLVPFTPLNKPNMIAWMAARNDGEHYGELVAYTFPRDRQIDGPQQVEARMNNDPRISQQFTLWGQQGSQIIRGNLIVIPLKGSLLYVEPVYLQASTLNFPELKRVIVVIGDRRPVMEPTLEKALRVTFGLAAPTPIGGEIVARPIDRDGTVDPTPVPTRSPDAPPPEELDQIIEDIEALLERLREFRAREN